MLSIWSINWISSVYSHEYVEYSNADFYSTTVSTLIILQCQLSLSSQACQLFSSVSLLSHAHFSFIQFFFDSNFLAHFSVVFLFDWFYFYVWDFDWIYCCKWLFCFVSCFIERFLICFISHHVLFSCLRFQSSSLLQAVIQFHAAFSEKKIYLHFQISEV